MCHIADSATSDLHLHQTVELLIKLFQRGACSLSSVAMQAWGTDSMSHFRRQESNRMYAEICRH
jgi:hypothetical protein